MFNIHGFLSAICEYRDLCAPNSLQGFCCKTKSGFLKLWTYTYRAGEIPCQKGGFPWAGLIHNVHNFLKHVSKMNTSVFSFLTVSQTVKFMLRADFSSLSCFS